MGEAEVVWRTVRGNTDLHSRHDRSAANGAGGSVVLTILLNAGWTEFVASHHELNAAHGDCKVVENQFVATGTTV
jgi:hypothetical protein